MTTLLAMLLALTACERNDPASASGPSGTNPRRVVLYTSCDQDILRPIIDAFEQDTGIDVLEVADTEATKTVGLYARLLDEQAAPRADVWWSNEPFYTARLAHQGLLEPFTPAQSQASLPRGWPEHLRAKDHAWHAFALRARVIAYDTRKLQPGVVPRTLRDLAEPRWHAKVGMARPTFGTTAGHIAALVHLWGEEPTRQWLEAMESQNLRLYDGNSSVVRAIAAGEIELGLTDTDDALAAQQEGLPIAFVYETDETNSNAPVLTPDAVEPMMSFGALVIPNTAALVKGAPNPDEARTLLEFLLSERAERLLMTSRSRNVPIREGPAQELFLLHPETNIAPPARVDLDAVANEIETARTLTQGVFGG